MSAVRVNGAPCQLGDVVTVVDVLYDHICDLSEFIGRCGTVVHLEYNSGVGQGYPDDPLIGVCIDAAVVELWKEEIKIGAIS